MRVLFTRSVRGIVHFFSLFTRVDPYFHSSPVCCPSSALSTSSYRTHTTIHREKERKRERERERKEERDRQIRHHFHPFPSFLFSLSFFSDFIPSSAHPGRRRQNYSPLPSIPPITRQAMLYSNLSSELVVLGLVHASSSLMYSVLTLNLLCTSRLPFVLIP